VDFWDLTKLLFRRWYVAVPLLVISVVAAGWTRTSVEPDYISTSYVQLIPPTAATTAPDPDAPTTPRNPWLELGLGSLSRAAALTVQDQAVLKQLAAAGYSENVAITLDNQQPIMTIEVIGESETQATETTEEVVRRLEASVVGLQADYGASEESFITTRRLDRGDNIQEANSKVNRAMIAVAGVGVLLSAALTIAVDGLLRRRRPRPSDAVPAGTGTGTDETIKLPSGVARPEGSANVRRGAEAQANVPRSAESQANGRSVANGASGRVSSTPVDPVSAGHGRSGQQMPRPRGAERDGAAQTGGVYSSGSVSQMRQDELRRLSEPQLGPAPMGAAPMAGTGPLGGQVPITGLTTNNSPTAQRPTGDRVAGTGAEPTNGRRAQGQRPSGDDTAVIGAVRDDATIILPKPPVGREPWNQAEASENGSRTR
jgi:hypothetical protein